jgi:dolichyl-phosphate beta-glucosyltransferase
MTADGRQGIYLSVVIPAYNEAGRIGPALRRVLDYLDAQPYEAEVLLVSDGSWDRTIGEVRAVAGDRPNVVVLDNRINRGKGFSVRRGVLGSGGRFVLFSDADLATPIEEVEKLLAFLQNGYNVAIASRGLPDSDIRVRQPLWRQSMGRVFNVFVQQLALPGIRDSQCGFKCFPREVAQRVFSLQRIERFGFDVEVLWIARKLGYRIAEIPVTWIDHPVSKVHPVRDSIRMLVDLLRIRFNDRRGVYS